MLKRVYQFCLIAIIILPVSGCAGGVGLTLLGVGAGTAAGTGVSHTLNGIAYKTFNTPEKQLHLATLQTMREMDIPVDSDNKQGNIRTITGMAADREIEIELETLTKTTTRMRVVASQGMIIKDSATATQLIIVTSENLSDASIQNANLKK